jgi:hypothetical protein
MKKLLISTDFPESRKSVAKEFLKAARIDLDGFLKDERNFRKKFAKDLQPPWLSETLFYEYNRVANFPKPFSD